MNMITEAMVDVSVECLGPNQEYFLPVDIYKEFKNKYDVSFNGFVSAAVPSFWFETDEHSLRSMPDFDARSSYINVYDCKSYLCFRVDADEPLADFVRQLAERDEWIPNEE